jgi:hypothetical protein
LNNPIKLLLAATALAVSIAAPAMAQTTAFTLAGIGSANPVSISVDGGSYESVYSGAYVGGFGVNPTTDSSIFCVDPWQDISIGQSYTAGDDFTISAPASSSMYDNNYYAGGLGSFLDYSSYSLPHPSLAGAQAEADEIAYIADTYLKVGTDATTQTNASLAIWDIEAQGNFAVSNWTNGWSSIVSTAQATYSGYTSSSDLWVQAPSQATQSFVVLTNSVPSNDQPGHPNDLTAPEPGLSAFLLALGLAGGCMYFVRKRNSVLA